MKHFEKIRLFIEHNHPRAAFAVNAANFYVIYEHTPRVLKQRNKHLAIPMLYYLVERCGCNSCSHAGSTGVSLGFLICLGSM